LATATAAPPARYILHERGNWSPRDDRKSFAVWLGIFWLGVVVGLAEDFPRYLHQNPPAPLFTHIHAVVFSVWLLIFTAQVLLVTGDRVALHRKLGWVAAGWAVAMLIVGPLAAMATLASRVHLPDYEPQFLAVNIVDLGGFFLLLAWGITLRKNPAAHKRVMLLAMVAIADPGFSRALNFLPYYNTRAVPWFTEVFYGNVLLIVLMAWWDWHQARLMKQFVIGATAILASELVAAGLYFSPSWRALTTSWVEAWARRMG